MNMYLKVDESFPRHPKTMKLCRLLGDQNAGMYVMRLWVWAMRSCPDGNVSGIAAEDLEYTAEWRGEPGKCLNAMVEAGFIDRNESGMLTLHSWEDRMGESLRRMDDVMAKREEWRKTKARQRTIQPKQLDIIETTTDMSIVVHEDKPRTSEECPANVQLDICRTKLDCPAPIQSNTKQSKANIREPLPRACAIPVPVLVSTPHALISALRVAVEREHPEHGLYNPGHWGVKNARQFLDAFETKPEEFSAEVFEKIETFAKNPMYAPWDPGTFAKNFNLIGRELVVEEAKRKRSPPGIGHADYERSAARADYDGGDPITGEVAL